MAAGRGEKLSEMALGWLLAQQEVTSVLIGASRPQQILDNIKAIHCAPFTEEELVRIDEIAAEKYSQYDHEIPDISSSLTVMNSITKKQIGLLRDEEKQLYFA